VQLCPVDLQRLGSKGQRETVHDALSIAVEPLHPLKPRLLRPGVVGRHEESIEAV